MKGFAVDNALKFGIVLLIILCLFLLVITFVELPVALFLSGFAESGEEQTAGVSSELDLLVAVEAALASASGRWMAFDYQVHHIQVQDDGGMAIVWLAAYDQGTGKLMAREPELALAKRDAKGSWNIILEDDEAFHDAFMAYQHLEASVHGDLDEKHRAVQKSGRVFGGYYLPWAEGLTKRLTWSVGHTSCNPIYYCTHAFDFADGTMFPLLAAKGGTVYHWRDSCKNNDSSCMNSITLEDRSTTPWTYQIYLHIAHNSIPEDLKEVGAPVLKGQYIADVDNTGPSTGHHVHFMVVSEETVYKSWRGYIFGVAEDITFRDVSINWDEETQGGRPRLEYEADSYGGEGQTKYISGNVPAFSPTGSLTEPATKLLLTDSLLTVSGWGEEVEEGAEILKLEMIVNYDGAWVQIGEDITDNPFTAEVDLCEVEIPNGPFTLALRIWDVEGNPSGLLTPRKLIKDIDCGNTGANPWVKITKSGDSLALPQSGFISADAASGSTDSDIEAVEFWFHGRHWDQDNWVYLGKGTDGTNGWQAGIDTVGMNEGSDYTIVAVATDSLGNKGVDVDFNAIVDKTPPWLNFYLLPLSHWEDHVLLTWKGGDNLSGLDYYTLSVRVNKGQVQLLESYINTDINIYQYEIEKEQLLEFELTAYDKSGNSISRQRAIATEGYEFEYRISIPLFLSD